MLHTPRGQSLPPDSNRPATAMTRCVIPVESVVADLGFEPRLTAVLNCGPLPVGLVGHECDRWESNPHVLSDTASSRRHVYRSITVAERAMNESNALLRGWNPVGHHDL